MRTLDISPNTHPVSDFLAWQRTRALNLKPDFQRRSIWKPGAASYFVDTIVRGLPVPLIFLRERLDLKQQSTIRDVVDGQQRLRTLLAFIDESSLPDFDLQRDRFTVRPTHNPEIANKTFGELSSEFQARILGYRFSVLTLPPEVEDRDILQIFARINSTGLALTSQELRNAAYFGVFKTLMYRLAYEQLERWQSWHIFSGDQLSRMTEVEFVSDLTYCALNGLSGKSQTRLDALYAEYDETFPNEAEYARRFRRTMDVVENEFGAVIAGTVFDREMHFYSLFLYTYDKLWRLGSPLSKSTAGQLPGSLQSRLLQLSSSFKAGTVPPDVLDSVARASTDVGRRRIRYRYTAAVLDGETG